jgi:hypothetical protein
MWVGLDGHGINLREDEHGRDELNSYLGQPGRQSGESRCKHTMEASRDQELLVWVAV